MPDIDWEEERDHYLYLLYKPGIIGAIDRWEVRTWFDDGTRSFRDEFKSFGGRLVMVRKDRTTRQVYQDTKEYMNGVRDSLKDRPASPRMAQAMMEPKNVWGWELNMTITLMLFKGVNNVRGSFWLDAPDWTAEEFEKNKCLTTLLCMRAEICKKHQLNITWPVEALTEYNLPEQQTPPVQPQVPEPTALPVLDS